MAIAFTRAGSGEPLVLIHGLGGSRRIWEPVIDRLAAERDVIAVDLPGFGASPVLPHGIPPSPANLGARGRRPLRRSSGSSARIWPATRSAPGRRSSSPSATSPRRSARSRRPGCGGRRSARGGSTRTAGRCACARCSRFCSLRRGRGRRCCEPPSRDPSASRSPRRGGSCVTGSRRPATRRRTRRCAPTSSRTRTWSPRRPRSRGGPRTAWSGGRARSGCRRATRYVELEGLGHTPTWDDPPRIAELLLVASDADQVGSGRCSPGQDPVAL